MRQPHNFYAFIPKPLPPDPPLMMDPALIALLSKADRAIGRLDGIAALLPNPELFVAMYVRREAVLSSQIEGTQSTLEDVLKFELDEKTGDTPKDVSAVVNYVEAMNYGLGRLDDFPLSLRLIRDIHEVLMTDVRGAEKEPGNFRTTQNYIGVPLKPLAEAAFVPPPVAEMGDALDNFEKFLHQEDDLPPLIRTGLAHAQFETIHPFLDGNGRMGRLLITYLLCSWGILKRPLLYLSYYLKRHQRKYYELLMDVREKGDWEGWLRFYLQGALETATEASLQATSIVRLREEHMKTAHEISPKAVALLDVLFELPIVNVNLVKSRLNISYFTANRLVIAFEEKGLLVEVTGRKRSRVYEYAPYLNLFKSDSADVEAVDTQATEEAELVSP